MRSRVYCLERRLVTGRRLPFRVHLALQRMEAREELFLETASQAIREVEAMFAREQGDEPETWAETPSATARRREQARRLVREDYDERHVADRNEVLRWELLTQGAPGDYAWQWGGDWQRRLFAEILAEVDAEFGLGPLDR